MIPETEQDWCEVPCNTLVRVRNNTWEDWKPAYFAFYDINGEYSNLPYVNESMKFVTGANGKKFRNTKNALIQFWRYCEIVDENEK